MVDIYRTTGEPRYLELAKKFLDMRSLVTDGGDDNQDRIPFLQQREAAGHAVRANYLYAGAADLFVETGDEASWTPLEAIWEDVVEKKMYITGGCGALLRWRVARWLGRPTAHYARAPGLWPKLPTAKCHGTQRDMRGGGKRAMELADVCSDR